MAWSFEEEQKKLYEKLLTSDEEITIDQFYEKYASPEYLKVSRKEHERLEALHKQGIYT